MNNNDSIVITCLGEKHEGGNVRQQNFGTELKNVRFNLSFYKETKAWSQQIIAP